MDGIKCIQKTNSLSGMNLRYFFSETRWEKSRVGTSTRGSVCIGRIGSRVGGWKGLEDKKRSEGIGLE